MPEKQVVGWAAILSGITGLLSFMILALFFVFELERAIENRWRGDYFFGNLNDIVNIFQALLLLIVVVGLHRLAPPQPSNFRPVVMIIGIVGLVLLAVTQALFVSKAISAEQQTMLFIPAWGTVGWWLSLVNLRHYAGTILPIAIRRSGKVIGLSLVFQMVVFFLLGGAAAAKDLNAIKTNIPLLIGTGTGLLIGLAGLPFWTIGVGYLLRKGYE